MILNYRTIRALAAVSLLVAATNCKTPANNSQVKYDKDEFETAKSVVQPPFGSRVAMDMEKLKAAAFETCRKPYAVYEPKPVVILDPPACFGWTEEQKKTVREERGLDPGYQFNCDQEDGLVFWEGNFVKARGDLLPPQKGDDQLNFQALPRASGEKFPVPIYVDRTGKGTYDYFPWTPGQIETTEVDGQGRSIVPPFTPQQIQPEGRYWVGITSNQGFIKGSKYDFRSAQFPDFQATGDANFPRVFVMGSNLYSRFIHAEPTSNMMGSKGGEQRQLDPVDMGKSLRYFAHNSTGIKDDLSGEASPASPRTFSGAQLAGPKQDFPHFKSLFVARDLSPEMQGHFLGVVDSEFFCGAVDIKLRPHKDVGGKRRTTVDVDGYWYARDDYSWKTLPNTGFVAISSMYFKQSDHDSDTLVVSFDDGKDEDVSLSLPEDGALRVHDVPKIDAPARKISGWALENRKRDELRVDGTINYKSRQSMMIDIDEAASDIKTGVRLYELFTNSEYVDNIVAMSQIRQDVPKSVSADKPMRFKYAVTSYYPGEGAPKPGLSSGGATKLKGEAKPEAKTEASAKDETAAKPEAAAAEPACEAKWRAACPSWTAKPVCCGEGQVPTGICDKSFAMQNCVQAKSCAGAKPGQLFAQGKKKVPFPNCPSGAG